MRKLILILLITMMTGCVSKSQHVGVITQLKETQDILNKHEFVNAAMAAQLKEINESNITDEKFRDEFKTFFKQWTIDLSRALKKSKVLAFVKLIDFALFNNDEVAVAKYSVATNKNLENYGEFYIMFVKYHDSWNGVFSIPTPESYDSQMESGDVEL